MTAPPTADRMLSLREVSKAYRGGKKANDAVSLDLRPGELVALLGHNGAGKSTLLKQIIGVLKPSSGSITYGPLDFVADPASARLYAATMPQDYSPLEGVTPYQAITSIAKIRGMNRRRARAAAEELIELLDIAAWRDIRGTKLSGGLRRLTSYAMATVARTEILLIDEPTNDVDPPRRELLWSHLRGLADEGRIVFVVTHNLMEVQRVADRCVLMDQGRIVTDLGGCGLRGADAHREPRGRLPPPRRRAARPARRAHDRGRRPQARRLLARAGGRPCRDRVGRRARRPRRGLRLPAFPAHPRVALQGVRG